MMANNISIKHSYNQYKFLLDYKIILGLLSICSMLIALSRSSFSVRVASRQARYSRVDFSLKSTEGGIIS